MRSFDTDKKRSARMSGQRSADTTPELAVRRALHAVGLRYFVHRRPEPDLRRTADIVFPRAMVAVFVDGCFWHGCPDHGNTPRANTWYWPTKIARNIERDKETTACLQAKGWLTIRVWEHEQPYEAAQRIASAVRARRSQKQLPLTAGGL